jgi:hypothetical protein
MPVLVRIYTFSDPMGLISRSGVVIQVYDETKENRISQVVSDEDGIAETILPGDETYYVFGFFPGVAYAKARMVLGDSSEEFELRGMALTPSPSPMPGMCRVHGLLLGANGAPLVGAYVRALLKSHSPAPASLFGGLVVSPIVEAKSNAEGILNLDLIRGAIYEVVVGGGVPGLNGFSTEIAVPESGAVTMTEVLSPLLRVVELSQPTLAVSEGGESSSEYVAFLGSGVPLPIVLNEEVLSLPTQARAVSSDPLIATAYIKNDRVVVVGRRSGQCVISFERTSVKQSIWPLPDPVVGTIAVTVV